MYGSSHVALAALQAAWVVAVVASISNKLRWYKSSMLFHCMGGGCSMPETEMLYSVCMSGWVGTCVARVGELGLLVKGMRVKFTLWHCAAKEGGQGCFARSASMALSVL
eukprot:882850-Pelagomonas_calceolata.AAC.5